MATTLVLFCLLPVALTQGPVYVNPTQAVVQPTQANEAVSLVTQTVYGFLDFTTTIGNTVMVFSPQSQKAEGAKSTSKAIVETTVTSVIEAKPTVTFSLVTSVSQAIKPTKTVQQPPVVTTPTPPKPSSAVVSTKVEVREATPALPPPLLSSIVEVRTTSDDPVPPLSGNNLLEPEYDFLSRQPTEVIDETYKVINLKPSAKLSNKAEARTKGHDARPTGLVSRLGGTVVKEGVTTVHETSVIGTYISGKYAQVLESTSRVLAGQAKPKPTPSSQLRILKTAAPSQSKNRPPVLEPTPAGTLNEETVALPLEALFSSAPSLVRSSRRPAITPGSGGRNSFLSRLQQRNKIKEDLDVDVVEEQDQELTTTSTTSYRKNSSRAPRPSATKASHRAAAKQTASNRFGRPHSTSEVATVSVFSETKRASRKGSFRPTATTAPSAETRRFKPKPSSVESHSSSTSIYKFKLARPAGERWQYKTTPKPRVTIRKQDEVPLNNVTLAGLPPTTPQPQPQYNPPVELRARSDVGDADSPSAESSELTVGDESAVDPQPPVQETIKVEISTPADFKDVYYEIATIKSPYTFQAGTVKNTRYITVTSTIEKTLESEVTPTATATEPLTENILATAYHKDQQQLLDSSIATLPPLALGGDVETPPLETVTETFSTTQLLLKTHILPVVRAPDNNTTRFTLIQSYHVTRLVTAVKTLPPMELYHFVPSKTLNEFNTRLDEAGSEVHLALDFSENDEEDRRVLDLAQVGSDFDLSDVDRGHLRLKKAQSPGQPPLNAVTEPPTTPPPAISPEQLQQLALLRLLNPAAAAAIPQVITTSRPVVKVETVWESRVVPLVSQGTTLLSTLSRPVTTVTKTEYEYGTSSLPPLPVNPLYPGQPQFAVTSSPLVTQTVVTQTESKILKLTFGAKTAYTTLFSTRVVPTILTTFVTASVPVQPTAAPFPGYFPPAYPQFPFVG